MELVIYRRGDGRMVVVPALYQAPVALKREGELTLLGRVEADLLAVSNETVEAMGERGYAVCQPQDERVLQAQLAGSRMPA